MVGLLSLVLGVPGPQDEGGADVGAGLLVLSGGLMAGVGVVLGIVWAVLAVHHRRRPA